MRAAGPFFIVMLLVLVLVSCSSSPVAVVVDEGLPAKAETAEGDFIYRLVSEKRVYNEGEPIAMYAELEYVGDQESITIYHAASPFYFPMVEKSRNYEIPYNMNLPLESTVLVKGQPLREEYTGSGGYSSDDPKDYIAFIRRVMDNDFPAGYYVVTGSADFYIEAEGEEIDYKIFGEIGFLVKS